MLGGIRLVVFDLAGTTVEDTGGVMDCFVESMEAVGLRADRRALNETMGQSKLVVLRALALRQLGDGARAEELAQAAFHLFQRCMSDIYRQGGARPIRGAESVFAHLRDHDVRVVLNTGFDAIVTAALVDTLGWRARVDAVVCVDDVPLGRPAPFMIHHAMQKTGVVSVHDVAVVGDTPSDLAAGAHSGAKLVIGVLTGAHRAASLRRHAPTHVLEGVWELPALLRRFDRLRPGAQRKYS
jgi:phosphonatase-like hydrolase